MKKGIIATIISVFLIAIILGIAPVINKITGKVVGASGDGMGRDDGMMGPSDEQQACMSDCYNVQGKPQDVCMAECNVEEQPEPEDEGEKCMQDCIMKGCSENYDLACQRANMQSCENKCYEQAPDESGISEEQKCITDCVNAIDPSIICGSGTFEGEGETGGEICQKCADSCVHLYEGPCLTDELWRQKEDECMSKGEHMEAMPVKGDSGEGYECTVDIECIDRSSEWGDEPGEGPGIGQEGYVAPNAVAGAIDGVIKFFKGLFGGGENSE